MPRIANAHPWRLIARTIIVLAMLLLITAGAAGARTFYVAAWGNDEASGRTPNSPWRTVTRVDKARLRPGDHVLFRAGDHFDDNALMPQWGVGSGGRARAPIVFDTYGAGRPVISQGVWFKGMRHLVFRNLQVGPDNGINATGTDITIQGCSMTNFLGDVQIPLIANGSRWQVIDNVIDRTRDSGMLLTGSRYRVSGNLIMNTGLDPTPVHGAHGIYLEASGSTVDNNRIVRFRDNGVSVRLGGNTVRNNVIVSGKFGIAYFQQSPRSGVTRWLANDIADTSIAALYVSPGGTGGQTHQTFIISSNHIQRPAQGGDWRAIALSRNRGRYVVRSNQVG